MEKEKIRVLHTAPLVIGGITSFVINVASLIDSDKYIIDNICYRDRIEFSEEKFCQYGGRKYVVDIERIKFKPYKVLKKFIGTYKIIKDNKIDIFHIDTDSSDQIFLAIAAKFAGVKKVIYHSHNTSSGRRGLIRKLIEVICKPLMNIFVDEYCACSNVAAEFLFPKKILKKNSVHIINNGIHLKNYIFNLEIRKEYRYKLGVEDSFVIGHIGRFTEQKNHIFLIDIFYEILKIKPNSKLLLIGIGELSDQIKEKVKKMGIDKNVVFLGGRDDVNKILQAMDVFIFPSLYEGLPVVGIEVQAASLPILVSDTITKELKITNKIEYVSLKDSPQIWAKKAIELANLKREDESSYLENAGYDINSVIQELEKMYSIND